MQHGSLTLNMNRETDPRGAAPKENILVVEDNGRIVSRRVSQVYGRALLGAMALRINSLSFRHLHDSFFPQIELLTLDKIRRTAQAVAPRDNFMFIDASRRILSCQVNPDYGVALLESLQQTLEDASHTQSVSSHATVTQASETSSNQRDTIAESSQCASKGFMQPHPNTPYSPLSISETLANTAGILSDQILSFANRQPYDRDWMSKYSINESCLDGPLSKHKLDVLVRYGAVKVGDRLRVTYHRDDGPVVKIGEVGFHSSGLSLAMLTFSPLLLGFAQCENGSSGFAHCTGPRRLRWYPA